MTLNSIFFIISGKYCKTYSACKARFPLNKTKSLISVLTRYDVSGAQTWMVGRAYRGVVGYVEQVNPVSDPRQRELCTNDCEVR